MQTAVAQFFGRERRLASAAVLVGAVLSGCGSPSDVERPFPHVVNVAVADGEGGIFRALEIDLDAPGSLTLDYWAPGVERLRLDVPASARRHEVWLPRLRAERQYSYEITPRSSSGQTGAVTTGIFGTGALPADVAALNYAVAEGSPTAPLLFVEVVEAFSGFLGAIIVDGTGEVVWYYRTTGRTFGSTRLDNGNFVILDVGEKLVEVVPDGREAASISSLDYGGLHHAITRTPQNTVLFIAYDAQQVGAEQVVGEALWEWNPATGSVVKRWSSFDHLDWNTDRGAASTASNWLHANGLSIGPRGNVVVSLRALNQVISLAPDFESIEWRLGGPNATIAVAGDAVFLSQHDAQELPGDRVLLFDNGAPHRPYSRGLELQLDRAGGTAEMVWEYAPATPNFATILGSTRRLSNGNTVVHFGPAVGVFDATGPTMTVEVDASGGVAWRLVAGESLQRAFRGTPLDAIAGEVTVD